MERAGSPNILHTQCITFSHFQFIWVKLVWVWNAHANVFVSLICVCMTEHACQCVCAPSVTLCLCMCGCVCVWICVRACMSPPCGDPLLRSSYKDCNTLHLPMERFSPVRRFSDGATTIQAFKAHLENSSLIRQLKQVCHFNWSLMKPQKALNKRPLNCQATLIDIWPYSQGGYFESLCWRVWSPTLFNCLLQKNIRQTFIISQIPHWKPFKTNGF